MVLIVLIFFKPGGNKTYYNKVILPDKNSVLNQTNQKYLDTLVLIGLEELQIENVEVEIKTLTDEVQQQFGDNSYTLNAAIVGNKYQFILYITDMPRSSATETIAHELIHLQQYHTEKLKILNQTQLRWDGKVLDKEIFAYIPYEQREWEIEAFRNQTTLKDKINKILF